MVKRNQIDLNQIKIQESEVEQVKLCDKKEVKEMLNENITVERKLVYEKLINYLK